MIFHCNSTPMRAHASTVTLVFIALLSAAACKTPPTINPFDVTDQMRPAADFLDAPVDRSQSTGAHRTRTDGADVMIPAASTTMSRTLDGSGDDWDLSRARTYKSKDDIEFGQEFWTGPNDASFRVALHADENYLYFLVDVIDDVVINSAPQKPIDAVRIWLRDPQLERLSNQLPESYQAQYPLRYDTALTITPDGANYLDAHGAAPANIVQSVTRSNANGYSLEVAIAIEAMPQISTFPMTEIAFRVELLDGDDPARNGPQTALSMLPDAHQNAPRFALFSTELLPHFPLSETSAPQNALGSWRRSQNTWQFEPLETITSYWHPLEELPPARTLISSTDMLPQLCGEARNDMLLLEAYQSSNGKNRVALLLCGPTPETGQCPQKSTSQVVWTHLVPQGDGWTVRRAVPAFESALTQCGLQAAANQPFINQFSMTPLTAISPSLWAVGWQKRDHNAHERIDSTGITLIDAQASPGRVGELHPQRTSAKQQGRTLRKSQVFFTQLDDRPGLDVCEIEISEDQECSTFNTNCQTPDHSKNTLCLIKTWNEQARKFEPYLFSKHPRCTPSTRFEQINGFMLLYINQRFALLPANPK